MDYIQIGVKLVIAIVSLWIITKVLGKKEISQLTAYDFVSSLVLSELVGNTIYEETAHIGKLLFALALWAAMSYGLEKLAVSVPWLSKRMSGSPELLIRNGLVDEKALKRNNLDLDQLHTMLREQQVFSIRGVAYAIFETNGNLSVLKKTDASSLPVIVIAKGTVDQDALRLLGKDEKWLHSQLREKGIKNLADVVFAEWTEEEKLHLQLKNDPQASFSVPVG